MVCRNTQSQAMNMYMYVMYVGCSQLPSVPPLYSYALCIHLALIHLCHVLPVAEECGIVAQVSAPLAHAEISTYYISTYYTDHTLVSPGHLLPTTVLYTRTMIDAHEL